MTNSYHTVICFVTCGLVEGPDRQCTPPCVTLPTNPAPSYHSVRGYTNGTLHSVQLHPCEVNFCLADGSSMDVLGEFMAEIRLGKSTYKHPVLVANLGTLQGLLGLDFVDVLQPKLDFSRGILEVGSQKIRMQREDHDGCCRIYMSETVHVPPDSQLIVEGVHKHFGKNGCTGLGTVEGLASITSNTGVLLARSLVDVSNN